MNTLFRTCFFFCIAMIIFSLCLAFVASTGAFPIQGGTYAEDVTSENALSRFTTLNPEDQNMDAVIKGAIGIGFFLALVGSALMRSTVPIGVYLFGAVFWAAYIKIFFVINQGGFIPLGFLTIVSVAMIFVFIGALIGMLTGSG